MRLPDSLDPDDFDERYRLDFPAWRPAVEELCDQHGLSAPGSVPDITAFQTGSNLVADIDDRSIVKIFPPFHEHQFHSERRVLRHLDGHDLPVKVPALIAEGTRGDGWPYVVVEKLPGQMLESCWEQFDPEEKARALREIGETMAAVHEVPLGDISDLPPAWGPFLRGQIERCEERHRQTGAPAWLTQHVDRFVRSWIREEDDGESVLLTGEYTPFNLMADHGPEGWRLTGMIDLGDAMIGPRDYDLLGPCVFSCCGDPKLVASLFAGYFGETREISHEWRMRLMSLFALHRYAYFDAQIRIEGWRDRADSLESLAELIWPEGG